MDRSSILRASTSFLSAFGLFKRAFLCDHIHQSDGAPYIGAASPDQVIALDITSRFAGQWDLAPLPPR